MNRDALLATLIGLGVGLVITGLLLVGPTLVKSISLPKFSFSFPSAKQNPSTSPTPAPTEFFVSIDSPLAEDIAANDELLVSGKTLEGTIVTVQGPKDEDVVTAKTDGAYAGKVMLIEGKNDITVTAYKDGKQMSQTVTVYFTPEEI
ncbi:hypothetical protein HY948_00365 [Candidatus Gottesmanbacteria bacterium]|nr:hypothetical protein [Candidatus Gottesmanbacteria bacterium]